MPKSFKSPLILIGAFAAALSGCTNKSDIDARIDEYMKTKGAAQMEEAVRKVLLESSQGKGLMPAPAGKEGAAVDMPIEGSPLMGNTQAKHTLVVFVDYTDPFSDELLKTAQNLLKEHKDDMKIVIKFAPAPQRGLSIPAAKAVSAAQELGKFSEYQSRVAGQRTQITQAKLIEWAKDVGLSPKDFLAKMEDTATQSTLKRDSDLLAHAGGGGAPVAFLDGVRLDRGEQSQKSIESHLSRQ